VGVDISAETTTHLRQQFGSDNIKYEHSDLFDNWPVRPVDCVISSAVFMHLYPTIAPALAHCRTFLRPGGHLCFDVPAVSARYLDIARRFYIRDYADPDEIKAFVSDAGYTACHVEPEPGFAPGLSGWFVCATA
jgi:SAM-dependent methyltransferase